MFPVFVHIREFRRTVRQRALRTVRDGRTAHFPILALWEFRIINVFINGVESIVDHWLKNPVRAGSNPVSVFFLVIAREI